MVYLPFNIFRKDGSDPSSNTAYSLFCVPGSRCFGSLTCIQTMSSNYKRNKLYEPLFAIQGTYTVETTDISGARHFRKLAQYTALLHCTVYDAEESCQQKFRAQLLSANVIHTQRRIPM